METCRNVVDSGSRALGAAKTELLRADLTKPHQIRPIRKYGSEQP